MSESRQQPSPGRKAEVAFRASGGFEECTHCPECGSIEGRWRGLITRQNGNVFHRRSCSGCGRWFYGVVYLTPSNRIERQRQIEEEARHDAWLEAFQEGTGGELP